MDRSISVDHLLDKFLRLADPVLYARDEELLAVEAVFVDGLSAAMMMPAASECLYRQFVLDTDRALCLYFYFDAHFLGCFFEVLGGHVCMGNSIWT